MPLTNGDDPTRGRPARDTGQHLDVRPDLLHPRCTDEDRVHGGVQPEHVDVLLEGVHLTPEGVAPHRDVEPSEGLLVGPAVGDPVGEHDHPGARPVDGQPIRDQRPQRLEELEGADELVHRRRLPPGDDEAPYAVQLTRAAHGLDPRAETLEDPHVLTDVALDGEHADQERREET